MSSRQQEKEKRREERLARERADAIRAKRARRVQLLVGGVLAAAAIAAVAVAVGSGGGDGGSSGPKGAAGNGVPIPAQRITDLKEAVAAARCAVRTFPVEGRNHTGTEPTPVKYKTNPPTSGDHNDVPAADGIYEPGKEPAKENYVHTLEHGRIELQYKPGTPARRIKQLETLFSEEQNGVPGYHMLLFQNNTNMPYAVAATAWTHLLGCRTFNDRVFDAVRAFRKAYTDKGPEFIP